MIKLKHAKKWIEFLSNLDSRKFNGIIACVSAIFLFWLIGYFNLDGYIPFFMELICLVMFIRGAWLVMGLPNPRAILVALK